MLAAESARTRDVLTFAGSILAAAICGLVATQLGDLEHIEVWLPAAVIVCLAIWTLYFLHTRHHDAFSPLGVACFFYVQMFAIGGAFYAITNEDVYGTHPYAPQDVIWAMWTGALAFAAFVAGYLLNAVGVLSRVLPDLPRTRSEGKLGTLMILLAIGWAARAQQFVSGRYLYGEFSTTAQSSGSSWLITTCATLPLVALGIAGARYYMAQREGAEVALSARWLFYGLAALEVVWTVPQGRRGDLVVLVVLVLALRYYGLMKRPTLPQVGLVIALGLFFIVPVVFDLRNDSQYRSAPIATLDKVVTNWAGTPLETKLERGTTEVFDRFNVVTSVAAIKRCECAPPLAAGTTFSWLGLSAIPRAIYPEKADPGRFAGTFGSHYAISDYSSIAITQPGEMVMNFGLLGVAFGMLIVGAFYRLLADFLRGRFTDPVILGVYAAVMWVDFESIIAVTLVGLIKTVAFYVLLLYGIAWLQGRVGRPSPLARTGRPARYANG